MNLTFANPGIGHRSGSEFDARPIVAVRRNDRMAWWLLGAAVIAAILLFSALEARRRAVYEAGRSSALTSYVQETVPDLVMPAQPVDPTERPTGAISSPQPSDRRQPRALTVPSVPRSVPASAGSHVPPSYPEHSYPTSPPPIMVAGQQLPSNSGADGLGSPPPTSPRGAGNVRRIMAGRLENPSTTVVQGTLINAVMETALDSTRPGQTRGLVTRDVYGFDGTRLLIPRGTRLYGVYQSDVAEGQKRAHIRWTRLLRPDGVSVALESPAADPLGRAGIEGKVNNHFIQRLGNALVRATANIGSALISRSFASSSPVIVAVPGATQTATQSIGPMSGQFTPALSVSQGTRLTVFVQHDLDFSSVDEAP